MIEMGHGLVRRAVRMLSGHVFLWALLCPAVVNEKVDNVKICVVASSKSTPGHTSKHCSLLSRSKRSPVSCVFATDRLECLRMVSTRKADFTVMEPEDLYFSSLWEESSILVVSELRAVAEEAFKYGAVVVVRNYENSTGVDLRGKKLCHPGLKSGSRWNDVFAQYLEERLAPRECEPGLSIYEDRIKTSANYFGFSCKAGPWVPDKEEDSRLKEQYSSMCSLCEMGDCRNSDKYRGNAGSALCFMDGLGDVLWARYDDVQNYFKKLKGGSEDAFGPGHNFLCEDGTLKPLTDKDPCFWLAMPWQVFGANPKSAGMVRKLVQKLQKEGLGDEEWERNFIQIIESYLHIIVNLRTPKTPEDYLKSIPGYLSAIELSNGNCKPRRSVRLCTSSAAAGKKCLWMSKAASSIGIQPSLECVVESNMQSCLQSVARGSTDLVVVPPDYLMDAFKIYGLKDIYYELPSREDNGYVMSAVVKVSSDIKKMSDLKNKKACFTRENGVGWNAALKVLQQGNWIKSICRGEQDLLKFFGKFCVLEDSQHKGIPLCCEDGPNKTTEAELMNSLWYGGCDVAFFDLQSYNTSQDGDRQSSSKVKYLRSICREDKPLNCVWYSVYPNILMINANITGFKYQEINGLIYQLADLLGRSSKNDNQIMEIFGPFENENNVLFRDTSVTFVKSNSLPSNSYQEILDELHLCSLSSVNFANSYLWTSAVICIIFNFN